MNDEELRAFLESATVGGNGDKLREPDDAVANAEGPGGTAGADAGPRREVPSFDELMNMTAPAAPVQQGAPVVPAQAPAGRLDGEPAAPAAEPGESAAEAAATPAESAAAAPADAAEPAAPAAAPAESAAAPTAPAAAPRQHTDWAQTFAQDEEELVPLILPGFSPEPRPRRDLPPVFRPETPAPAPVVPEHNAGIEDPAATQPFDVLAAGATAQLPQVAAPTPPEPQTPTAHSPAAQTRPIAPHNATPTAAAAAAPAAAANTEPIVRADAADENPFALLAPELVAPSADQGDDYERIAVTGGGSHNRKAMPWLIVGGGAVVALIASVFVINGVRGTEVPAPTEKPAATAEPAPTETTQPTEEPEPSEEPTPEPSTAPVVDPGSTYDLAISQWGLTVPRSEAFGGSTPYTLFDSDSRAMFTLPLAESLSNTCEQASKPEVWGLHKKDDGKLEVIRPEPRCTDANDAAVYDKIWGLMDYMAKHPKQA